MRALEWAKIGTRLAIGLSLFAAAPSSAENDLLIRERIAKTGVVRWSPERVRRAHDRRERVEVREFPLDAERNVTLELEPFSVTRPSTRFVLGRKGGADQPLDFDAGSTSLFRGRVKDRPGSNVFLALGERRSTGFIDLGAGETRFRLSSRGADGRRLARGRTSVFEAKAASGLPPDVPFCGNEDTGASSESRELSAPAVVAPVQVGLKQLELAVETDYEFFQLFDDAADAAAYLVALYGEVSAIYQRDVDTRIDLVYVRLWEDPNDLFNVVDPSPLNEFRSYWNANMGGVSRDIAQLVSGRRDYPFGGQAYLSTLCGSSGYSVVGYMLGFFPDPSQPSPYEFDISVTAHEIGHNAGTGHTHDSPNFVDTCDDPLTTPQRGSIMSYCGQTWSGGNSNRDGYFHSRIQLNMEAHIGGSSCIVPDCNGNGVDDDTDIFLATSLDVNGNDIPDECEDCNGNFVLDPDDISGATSQDLNSNGVPDECEPDCNANNVPDDKDIADGTSLDDYGDDIPDECETDCNSNSISDYSEIQLDMSLDIDRNARLDACQDCDDDGTPDLDTLAGAHDMWLASGLSGEPLRRFSALTGVRAAVSGGSSIDEGQDVIATPDGRVLVTSAGDHRVLSYDSEGNFLGELVASGAGGLDHPHGLVLAPNGDLLVTSAGTNSVLAFDAQTGAPLGAFVASGAGGLSAPFALVFGPNGNLFVTSGGNEVLEFDGTTGAFVGTFVDNSDNANLSGALGMTFKPDGNLLVTSYDTDRTLEFDGLTGEALGKWAQSGTATRLTQVSPWGIRVGPNGNVFIVRTGEDFGSGAGGAHHDHDHHHEITDIVIAEGELHLTNAQIYEFDVRNGNFLRSHINGNDHGMMFPTGFDFVSGWDTDCNFNQRQDDCDVELGTSPDEDSDGTPDECQLDCNLNGNYDRLDIIPFGSSYDCNYNGTPDECDLAFGVPGACQDEVELQCADGFDNDRDGFVDCFDPDCGPSMGCFGTILLQSRFDSDAEGFTYQDDLFRGTNQPAYATGSYSASNGYRSGSLTTTIGNVNNDDIDDMSGGFTRDFVLAEDSEVEVAFRYRLTTSGEYESNEFSQVLVSVDGSLLGQGVADFVVQLNGDGNGGVPLGTGWAYFVADVGFLSAGNHTLSLGGYNNRKTTSSESVEIRIDDVAIFAGDIPDCRDGVDNDGDELIDHPADPGCATPDSRIEDPQCSDGIDNDMDGAVDLADPTCQNDPTRNAERASCGIGPGLLLVGLTLLGLRRSRRL